MNELLTALATHVCSKAEWNMEVAATLVVCRIFFSDQVGSLRETGRGAARETRVLACLLGTVSF